ncbi:MAG: type III polyketide synthase [Corynebacteriales bacterium]|nr:type III polyketide synthase [Mycobacteriales bacterium]
MTSIAAVHGVTPENRFPQQEITNAVAQACLPPNADRRLLDRLHTSATVQFRNLVLPLEAYEQVDGFGAVNRIFIEAGQELAATALKGALAEAEIRPTDIDMIMCASVTGIAAPSLDARLVGRMGMRPDVRRVPIFGLGCVAGVAGLARVSDYLRGWQDHTAVLLCVELCSLTVQRGDSSPANLVASGLFSDGAAAVVLRGAACQRRGPQVLGTVSHLYPDTEQVMGWEVTNTGLKVVLDASVPQVVRTHLANDVEQFLAQHGLSTSDIGQWVCHAGGPKVLKAVAESLNLDDAVLARSWKSLADNGNMSSVSVLHVLQDTMREETPAGTYGLMIAMGPGFCSELVLLRW